MEEMSPGGGKQVLGVKLIAHSHDFEVSHTGMHLQSYGEKLGTPKVTKADRESPEKYIKGTKGVFLWEGDMADRQAEAPLHQHMQHGQQTEGAGSHCATRKL